MPKAKNWTKRKEGTWDHDKQPLVVDVWSYDAAPGVKKWEFTITNTSTNENFAPYNRSSFENKTDARDAARKWIKRNPSPNYKALKRKYKGR